VGIIVPHQFQGVGLVPRGDQRQLRITFERAGDVEQLSIHARADGGLGEAGADRGGDIGRRGARRHFTQRAIGQGDLEQV
jgi:hypothetical protein